MPTTGSPVNAHSGPRTSWSRVNFSEAIQGVQTPLSWTFWEFAMETAVRRGFGALGVLTKAEVPPPANPDDRISAAFFGLPAGNVNTFRRIGDRMPGTNGDTVAEQMFGEPRGAAGRVPLAARLRAARHYPVIGARTASSAYLHGKHIRAVREELRIWWLANTIDDPPTSVPGAQQLLREAAGNFVRIGTMHTTLSLVGQAFGEQVELLALKGLGSREAAASLMTGYGRVDETEVIGDLWRVAHDGLMLTEFVSRHGYHGPDEGNLPSRVWREDPTQLNRLVDKYRARAAEHPDQVQVRQEAVRLAAEAKLLKNLNGVNRVRARLVLRLASIFIPIREVGKAGFLHCIDGARCAARIIGEQMAISGQLLHADDVFFLTYDELVSGAPHQSAQALQQAVAARKADDEHFLHLDLPASWVGNPQPIERAPVDDTEVAVASEISVISEISGIGVCGGQVTGTARVVTDPQDADLEDGDILVCEMTDPSWTPLFMLAEALVIDTGGVMSHGAIVARELGLTCVINTKSGTRDIPDGATITVDGGSGRVIIHQPLKVGE